MDKTKAIGAVLLLVAVVVSVGWLWQMARHWRNPVDLVHTLAVINTLALLAILGLVGWIGYTMASMKIEVPPPPPPETPAEKKS